MNASNHRQGQLYNRFNHFPSHLVGVDAVIFRVSSDETNENEECIVLPPDAQ